MRKGFRCRGGGRAGCPTGGARPRRVRVSSPSSPRDAILSSRTQASLLHPRIYEASQRRGRIGVSSATKRRERPFGLSDKAEYSSARDRRDAGLE
ncbi:hypothetical protein CAJAP_07190 [Camponotus japonicus]